MSLNVSSISSVTKAKNEVESEEKKVETKSAELFEENDDNKNDKVELSSSNKTSSSDNKAEKEIELAKKEKELKQEQEKYDKLTKELEEKSSKFEKITEAIENAVKKLEKSAQEEQKSAIYKAMANYNKEEDGNWSDYLQKQLEGVMPSSSLKGLIGDLSNESESLINDFGSLQTKIADSAMNIDKLTSSINEIKGIEGTEEVEDTSTSMEQLKSLVSEEEWALVEENNIDLTETLSDGSPKYIFAKGQQDGEYHIYEMAEGSISGVTLAREYCRDCKGYGQGYDIVPMGNGYMSVNPAAIEGQGETCYYMTPCGGVEECCKCYCTCSPLSFDLEGDGVKTSDKVVEFDIDGDGKMDKINDSADAILVFDKDHDGISGEDGSECFGDNTDLDNDGKADKYKNGFEALRALAEKEGLVNGGDTKIDKDDIKILEEKYGLKIKTNGYNSEAKSLLDVGFEEINVSDKETNLQKDFDGNQNDLMTQEGATFKINGQENSYADIWHSKKDDNGKTIYENNSLNLISSVDDSKNNEDKKNDIYNNMLTIKRRNSRYLEDDVIDNMLLKNEEILKKALNTVDELF